MMPRQATVFAALALMLVAVPLRAQVAAGGAIPAARAAAREALASGDSETRQAAASRLGEIGTMDDVEPLLAALRDEDEAVRALAEASVESIWSRSGDRGVDLLYRQGVRQMAMGAYPDAVLTFTRIVRRKPDFAEAWNKRATVYYTLGDFDRALADCAETLKRNPRHYGALAGYGLIYMHKGEPERALDYFGQALEINPNLDDVREHSRALRRMIDEKIRHSV